MFKFQKSFVECKWVIMCMRYKQSCVLWYKKLKLEVFIIVLTWFEIYDHFSKWNIKIGKICTFKFFHIYSKNIDTSNVVYWGNCKYFKKHVAKKIASKNPFMKKSKCSKRAHLWLNSFSSLGHLIMIAPTMLGFLFGLISLESILFFFSFGKQHFIIHLESY